jgi:uncharacterized protein (TIGR02391 family)
MRKLSDLIPNYEGVLRMEPEHLAGVLLEILIEIDGSDRQFLHRGNFFRQFFGLQNYPNTHGGEVIQATFEAWIWLEREGFLIPRLGNDQDGWLDLSRRAKRAGNRKGVAVYRKTTLLPFAELHPTITSGVYPMFLRGDYDTAVFQAFKEVEISVRGAAKLGNDRLGCTLMRDAFTPKSGPLCDPQEVSGEQIALMELFAGAIGYFKNPGSHREVELSAIEAAEAIMLASRLLRVVDSRTEKVSSDLDIVSCSD